MHPSWKQGWFSPLLASMLVLLLVYTATSKLMERQGFEAVLSRMPYLHAGAPVLSWAVPLSEIFISILLLLPATRREGFFFSLLLLLAFTGYLGLMLLLAPHLPCSCGGVISGLGWGDHFLFNLAFLLMAFTGWRIEKDVPAGKPPQSGNQLFIRINPLPGRGRRSRKPVSE